MSPRLALGQALSGTSSKLPATLLACVLVVCLACTTGLSQPERTPAADRAASATPPADSFPALELEVPLQEIGFGSCLDQAEPQPILDAVLARDFDLFLMLGDNVYGDVTSTTEMAELREAYANQSLSERFLALRRAVPMLAVWDDHDFGANDAGATFAGREAAGRLFEDFWQIPPRAPSRQRPGIYDSHLVGPPGRRVQILLLDTRFFRSDLKKLPRETDYARYEPDPETEKTMLGAAQWRWLEQELREEAELRLLVSSIQILAEGHGWEAWRTLPLERERLYDVLKKTVANGVIALSGDRHRAGIYRRDDVIDYPLYEITSSSLNRPSESPEEPGPHRLGPTYRPENFGAVHIDWTEGEVRLEIADMEGETVLSETIELAHLGPTH